jgi:hypothetical protein
MVAHNIERLIGGQSHMELEIHSTNEQWRLHLRITANDSRRTKEQHYRTKLSFQSKEDCERWHKDYFSTMLRLIHDDTVSRPFRATVVCRLIELFEPVDE